jgi:hypothetical protein
MRDQIGEPGGVVHIRLTPGNLLDVGGVGQHQFELTVRQNVPHRLPIHACGFHSDMRCAFA